MARWEWKDRFSVEIPENWEVREPGDVIELVPPDNSGAGHISYLKRKSRDVHLKETDVKAVVEWFQKKRGASAPIRCGTGSKTVTAVAHFETNDNTETMLWDVLAVGNDNAVCLCSYCYSAGGESFASIAKDIFNSINLV